MVYDVLTAFRYEDNIQNLHIWNSTVGGAVTRAFQAAASTSAGLEVRNLLVLGTLPAEAVHASNLAVAASAFTNAAMHDYTLAPGFAGYRRSVASARGARGPSGGGAAPRCRTGRGGLRTQVTATLDAA